MFGCDGLLSTRCETLIFSFNKQITSETLFCRQVEQLLESGAHVDQARDDGSTALHDACALGNPDVASLLIKHHADVNKKDATGA